MNPTVKLGLIAAGLYIAWSRGLFDGILNSGPAVAPPPPGAPPVTGGGGATVVPTTAGYQQTTTPTVTGAGAVASIPVIASAVLVPALIEASGSGDTGLLNADQWNWYRNKLYPPDMSPSVHVAVFGPFTDTDRGPRMTAGQFVEKLKGAGLAY